MANQALTERFIDFYQDHYPEEIEELAEKYPDEKRSLYISHEDLEQYDDDLAADFRAKPDQMREYAEEALRLYDLPSDVSLSGAHVRITGLSENIEIGDIRARDDQLGSLVSVRGVVRKATEVHARVTEAAFECQRCGTQSYIPQTSSDEFQEPSECLGCEKRGPFTLNIEQSEYVDHQEIRVQATPDGVGTEETPPSIEVNLADDLCGQVTPGDHVSVTGILRGEQLEDGNSKTGLLGRYIDGVAVTQRDELAPELTNEQKEEIIKQSGANDIYEKFVRSISPSIHGLETEKLAVLLQLFSGVAKEMENEEPLRGQIHVLFAGDPAVGISRILRSAVRLSPRSTYTNGAETSKAGLTAAAARTGGAGGPWELKSGALPIADRGLAAIDNIEAADGDVMGALPEPMERQQITISKASIHESIDTRVGVLAAGSSPDGRFDLYEPLGDQLPVDTQVLTLFDLAFTVLDNPQPDTDEEIAQHILGIHHAGEQEQAGYQSDPPESATAPFEPGFVRDYITYARQITPVLTDDAKEWITDFYVDLRSRGADEDAPVPVSARKLEALVRLSEASARVRLSESIELEDAKRVTDLVEASLKDVGVDPETGQFDADVVETGTSQEQRERIGNVKELVAAIEQQYEAGAPIDEVLDRAGEAGLEPGKVEAEIEKLRTKGKLYEPKQGHLRTAE
jgi:replicative DNA helicase Mcm